jgi:hypothetical protein
MAMGMSRAFADMRISFGDVTRQDKSGQQNFARTGAHGRLHV